MESSLRRYSNKVLAKWSPLCSVVFRSSLALGQLPKMWRELNIVFIQVPGRDDYSQGTSLLPINLTPFIMKNSPHTDQCVYYLGNSFNLTIHNVRKINESALDIL